MSVLDIRDLGRFNLQEPGGLQPMGLKESDTTEHTASLIEHYSS